MTGWRDEIVGELAASTSPVTVVTDPDELLLEERMLQRITDLGYHVITFDDHVAFRFEFESRLRSMQGQGVDAPQRVLIRVSEPDANALPYDLLFRARRLTFGLDRLFPKLSYPVVASLDRPGLDDLFAAHQLQPPRGRLGDRRTRAYVLRHMFGVAAETIAREGDLLRFLLRRHYRALRIPAAFDADLLRLLGQDPCLPRVAAGPDRSRPSGVLHLSAGALARVPGPDHGGRCRPRGRATGSVRNPHFGARPNRLRSRRGAGLCRQPLLRGSASARAAC